jgi:hypothetical protein
VVSFLLAFPLLLSKRQYLHVTCYCSRIATAIVHALLLHPLSLSVSLSLSLSVFPVAPTWSVGHPWNALFHFSFLILKQSVGSARRKAATYTQSKRKHPCLEWDSNPRSQCSKGRRQFMLQTARPLWSAGIVLIYTYKYIHRSINPNSQVNY